MLIEYDDDWRFHQFVLFFSFGVCSMGSTRFFKVARVRSDEGLIVIKVFVKHDPSLPLETHAERVMMIQKSLSNAVNCLPFQRVQVTEKVALVMREYVKHSLYDRVSTRPFLTSLEKKWITFQVLCALHQCHRQKICHGDIKVSLIQTNPTHVQQQQLSLTNTICMTDDFVISIFSWKIF